MKNKNIMRSPECDHKTENGYSIDDSSKLESVDADQTSMRFKDVAILSADWFWDMDQDLCFTYLSEGFEKTTGLRVKDILGKTREQAFSGMIDDAEKWQRLGADLHQQNTYSMVWALKRQDGGTRILRARGKPFFDVDGEFQGYHGVGNDITELIGIMEALEISENRLRVFSELAADWFFELDKDFRISFFSGEQHIPSGKSTSDMIGLSEKEWAREHFGVSNYSKHYLARLEAREPYQMDYELQRKDGSIVYIRNIGVPFYDDDGEFEGYRCCGTDITKARIAEINLQSNAQRFQKIIENVTDIIAITNCEGLVSYHNNSVEKILGYTVDDLDDLRVGFAAIPEDYEIVLKSHNEAMANPGRVVKVTYRGAHKDGSIRVLETSRQRILESDNAEVVVHARDITEQYRAEQALQESEQKLRDFAETAADWFWEQDANLRFTNLFGNYPDFAGINAEKIIGKTREQISPGHDYNSKKWRDLRSRLDARLPFSNFDYPITLTDGSIVHARISGKPVFDKNGEFKGYRGTAIDISESYELSEKLSFQASHDPLTDLQNRREFENRLTRVIAESQKDTSEHALCYIDLDQFKVVNDTCGHEAGDELLRRIAAILRANVRKRDTLARLGGDEFGLLFERCTLTKANRVAETVRQAIDDYRFLWGGKNFKIGASIGLIPINSQSGNFTDVMREADAACYEAKDRGRNRIVVSHAGNMDVARRHKEMELIVDINEAFDNDRFVIYQQPILPLQAENQKQYHMCEILVRMMDEEDHSILPINFLPAAEHYNLITRLDTWVVNTTLDWMSKQSDNEIETHCAINLSGMSIADDDFLQFMLTRLNKGDVDASQLCFEITETSAIANFNRARHFIKLLRERGCYFALDDFGSGMSSFAYLKKLSVDYLKIDGFFVRDVLKDDINLEMVKSINHLAHVMGMKTIAEFVEDEKTMETLREIGVDYAQGFAISRPTQVSF